MMNNKIAPTRAPWLYDVKPFHIVDNLYYVGNGSVSSHLFDTGEGLLLLDTTYVETAYQLFESIRELGFNPSDVKWIIHSHGHYDHFGATRLIKEKYGAKAYLSDLDVPLINKTTELNLAEDDGGGRYEIPYDTYFDTDVEMHDGDEFTFGNTKMKCISAPGHTSGTMALFFTLPCGLIAAMHGGLGRNTLTSEFIKKYKTGIQCRTDYLNSLLKLKGMHVDVTLGNHPDQNDTFEKYAKVGKVDGNPFVDSSYWDKMIDFRIKKYKETIESDPI